ncbi:MAG: TetR family transcriptional regulator [Thermoflexales bacterium]|nr:TetR family transcriptional regulator [Thermoflexales bacterium]MDW8352177.1 TetR family transcriptional regulator [Anaerolineae bacterium]
MRSMRRNSASLPILNTAPQRAERADAVANRQRILATADKLFAKRGVANVHMADIAKAARVGQGTLYRHFANKGELCLALLDAQMAEFQDRTLSTLREMSARRERKLEQLLWFLDAVVRFNARHAPLLCAAQREMMLPASPTGAPFQWQRLTVIGLLQGAERDGEIEASLDLPVIADVLLAPTHPPVFNFLHATSGYTLDRISAAIQQVVRGLGCR